MSRKWVLKLKLATVLGGLGVMLLQIHTHPNLISGSLNLKISLGQCHKKARFTIISVYPHPSGNPFEKSCVCYCTGVPIMVYGELHSSIG